MTSLKSVLYSNDSMMDYTIFYKSELPRSGSIGPEPDCKGSYDVFLSGYNSNDRVNVVFDRVLSRRKVWVIHNEYAFEDSEMPRGAEIYRCSNSEETVFFQCLMGDLLEKGLEGQQVCVDVTGLVPTHMMYLLAMLGTTGLRRVDCLYSEPLGYIDREDTAFTKGAIRGVRHVPGFGGVMNQDVSSDLLIIGAGYDDRLISEVAQYKGSAKKVVLFGFPSSRADMYQQNVLRVSRAEEALGPVAKRWRFLAPANDPFVTAAVLNEIVYDGTVMDDISNLYLAPISSKAQAIGFALFFLYEKHRNENMNIIFPYCDEYAKVTGRGIARTWRFELELP